MRRPWVAARQDDAERLIVNRQGEDPRLGERLGNGTMVAFAAATRDQVDAAHALALSLGAVCEGRPGLRPEYHAHYYGAYFRDADGNKLCVACHAAPL